MQHKRLRFTPKFLPKWQLDLERAGLVKDAGSRAGLDPDLAEQIGLVKKPKPYP